MKQCVQCRREYPDSIIVCNFDGQPLLKAASSLAADPMINRVIMEKYQIVKLIGSGGMGSVYEGKHLLLDRQVAIKLMNAEYVSNTVAMGRFIREAKSVAKLDHPNAVTIYDFGPLEEGGAFIVMEFINGGSLRGLLIRTGALPLKQALECFAPVCSAVEAAHKAGIIHRDLKPENIMLKQINDELIVKVIDFGLAKPIDTSDISEKLTKTGAIIGTPQYISPEVFNGESADTRADIYALGIIFYEMVTGNVPFGSSMQNIIAGHLLRDPKPPSQSNPNLTLTIDQAIGLALKKKRDERIGSAKAFLAALKSAADIKESLASPSLTKLLGNNFSNVNSTIINSSTASANNANNANNANPNNINSSNISASDISAISQTELEAPTRLTNPREARQTNLIEYGQTNLIGNIGNVGNVGNIGNDGQTNLIGNEGSTKKVEQRNNLQTVTNLGNTSQPALGFEELPSISMEAIDAPVFQTLPNTEEVTPKAGLRPEKIPPTDAFSRPENIPPTLAFPEISTTPPSQSEVKKASFARTLVIFTAVTAIVMLTIALSLGYYLYSLSTHRAKTATEKPATPTAEPTPSSTESPTATPAEKHLRKSPRKVNEQQSGGSGDE